LASYSILKSKGFFNQITVLALVIVTCGRYKLNIFQNHFLFLFSWVITNPFKFLNHWIHKLGVKMNLWLVGNLLLLLTYTPIFFKTFIMIMFLFAIWFFAFRIYWSINTINSVGSQESLCFFGRVNLDFHTYSRTTLTAISLFGIASAVTRTFVIPHLKLQSYSLFNNVSFLFLSQFVFVMLLVICLLFFFCNLYVFNGYLL